jgi:AhpD family alkylhydroperoxidase
VTPAGSVALFVAGYIRSVTTTDSRLDLRQLAPDSYDLMIRLAGTAERAALDAGLGRPLLELVRIRASQLNGCAFCLDLHTRDARRAGETEQRLAALDGWAASPLFEEDERAALRLAEAITLIHRDRVPDHVYQEAVRHFGEERLAQLVWVITVVNSFNRLAVTQQPAPAEPRPAG